MEKKSARKNEASENESDDADRSSDPTREEEATDSQSEEPDSPVGNVRKAGRSGSVQASAVGGTPSGQKGGSRSFGGEYVNYERGSDPGTLSARYGLNVRDAEAGKLQRLEREFGRERVGRWAEEGMTVETMGKPRDMQAFRTRQEERSEEVPTDIERRNEASLQRNANEDREDGPAGKTGVPDVVRSVVSSPGRSMNETVQREMETKMGGDFSDVQIHTGPKAAAAAESINARAFTVGDNVAFNRGEYNPSSKDGKKVLAHELTHVRQQSDGRVSMLPKSAGDTGGNQLQMVTRGNRDIHVQPKLEISAPDNPAEKEAERVANRVVEMDTPAIGGESTSRNNPRLENKRKSDTAANSPNQSNEIRSYMQAGRKVHREDQEGGGKSSKSGAGLSTGAEEYWENRLVRIAENYARWWEEAWKSAINTFADEYLQDEASYVWAEFAYEVAKNLAGFIPKVGGIVQSTIEIVRALCEAAAAEMTGDKMDPVKWTRKLRDKVGEAADRYNKFATKLEGQAGKGKERLEPPWSVLKDKDEKEPLKAIIPYYNLEKIEREEGNPAQNERKLQLIKNWREIGDKRENATTELPDQKPIVTVFTTNYVNQVPDKTDGNPFPGCVWFKITDFEEYGRPVGGGGGVKMEEGKHVEPKVATSLWLEDVDNADKVRDLLEYSVEDKSTPLHELNIRLGVVADPKKGKTGKIIKPPEEDTWHEGWEPASGGADSAPFKSAVHLVRKVDESNLPTVADLVQSR